MDDDRLHNPEGSTEVVWKPQKRRAFLGRFAPALFDRGQVHEISSGITPNAVLENAIGLMLCYDELWFLHRRDCPMDMQDLDFVRFVEDDPALLRTAAEAYWQCLDALPVPRGLVMDVRTTGGQIPGDPFSEPPEAPPVTSKYTRFWEWVSESQGQWSREIALQWISSQRLLDVLHKAVSASYDRPPGADMVMNHHSRSSISRKPLYRLQLELLQMAEWSVVDSLQLGPMDYIVNTGMSIRAAAGTASRNYTGPAFGACKFEALERVLHLRSTEVIGRRGPYQDYIADLRKHDQIKELRQFLAGQPSSGSAESLATEMDRLVTAYVKEGYRRTHRPTMLRTLGTMSLGALVNQILPGFGGAVGAIVNADRTVSDFKFRARSRWAAFIIDTHESLSRGGKWS